MGDTTPKNPETIYRESVAASREAAVQDQAGDGGTNGGDGTRPNANTAAKKPEDGNGGQPAKPGEGGAGDNIGAGSIEDVIAKSEEDGDGGKAKTPIGQRNYSPVTDDDFSVGDDGKVVIKAQHIKDDIDQLKDKPEIVNRILRRDPKKLDVMALALGIKGDTLRSPGREMADIFDAYQRAVINNDTTLAEKIKTDFMPDALFGEGELNGTFDIKPATAKVENKPAAPQKSEWKFDPSAVKTEVEAYTKSVFTDEAERAKWSTQIMRSSKVGEILSTPRFNPETGQPLSPKEHLAYALSVAFPKKEDTKANGAGGTAAAFNTTDVAENKEKVDAAREMIAKHLPKNMQEIIKKGAQ